jgi:hypothetical protein
MGSVVLGGATSGSTTLTPVDAVTAVITLPSVTDTLVGKATTDTLTNKTLTSPVINTPSASGQVYSGTYTPTLFNTTNIDASTAFVCQYIRVGNVVTVSGNVNIDFTAAASTSLGMSLPIASTFTNASQLGGVASSGVSTINTLGILADLTNSRAQFDGIVAATVNTAMRFSFTYLVV